MLVWIHKLSKDIRYILKWMFVLLMVAQIVLGIGWILANIMHLPMFHETILLNRAADLFVVDEYMGILYPVLIKMTKWIEKVSGFPFYSQLYALQLISALGAFLYMLRYSGWISGNGLLGKLKYGLAALYMLTFPLLLQLHMAVLPYSLAASISIIMICDGLYYLYHMEEVRGSVLIRLCGLWMLVVLLLPDYSWMLGIFMMTLFVKILYGNKIWRNRILICMLSTVLCFGVIGNTTQVPGSMGRIQKSASSCLLSRFVWPNLGSYSFFWPQEVGDIFTLEELSGMAVYSESMMYDFGPVLEENYGKETANNIYFKMAVAAFGLNTKQILIDTGRDFVSYLCPQIAFQQQQKDNRGALLAWNYGRLQEQTPMLTKYYVNISFACWNVLCVLGGLLILIRRQYKVRSYAGMMIGSSTLFMAFWYTMQGAGIQDYKKVMLISLLWLLPVIKGFVLTDK